MQHAVELFQGLVLYSPEAVDRGDLDREVVHDVRPELLYLSCPLRTPVLREVVPGKLIGLF